MNRQDEFRDSVQRDSEQQKKSERQKAGLFGFLLYGGTLGMLMVIPMVAGAYLGRWLDALGSGYETRWTVSLIVLGIASGVWNVIWYLRGRL